MRGANRRLSGSAAESSGGIVQLGSGMPIHRFDEFALGGGDLFDMRELKSIGQPVNRIYHYRPVDEVVREPRGLAGARLLNCQVLIDEGVMRHFGTEEVSFPEILVADVRNNVVLLRLVDIGRRAGRIEADVTEGAGHADIEGRFNTGRILEILC